MNYATGIEGDRQAVMTAFEYMGDSVSAEHAGYQTTFDGINCMIKLAVKKAIDERNSSAIEFLQMHKLMY